MNALGDLAAAVTQLECREPRVTDTAVTLRYAARAGDEIVMELEETIELPCSIDAVPHRTLTPILRLLTLAASLSYFKAFAPAALSVPDGLTAEERTFAGELIRHGLGEFAYVNQLPAVLETEVLAPELPSHGDTATPEGEPARALVAVGGGKDSIVSIESLKAAGLDVGLFSVNSYQPIEETAKVAGIALTSARRRLDPQLFELNAAGAPNGHVPVTAVNSLVAVLTAAGLDYDTVVFSNEASSSYGNTIWAGQAINHQWSKGIDFERLLRASLPPGAPRYVSLLRPITELRIARRFAQLDDYHSVFTSCNRAFRLREEDRSTWCGDCPKCRFVFLIMAPFLSRADLLQIFGGRDLLADAGQAEGFLELLGADGLLKPFECVGEPDECRVALALLREHPDWQEHPFLARPELSAWTPGTAERDALFAFREHEHTLPGRLEAAARAI